MPVTRPDIGGWRRRVPVSAALFVALALLAGVWPQGVRAGASPWAETEQTALRLVSASQAVGEGGTVHLGLHFRLKEGWKVYWRSPGDAGFPPRADWSGSENLATANIAWPVPERFSILGFESLGYTGEVVLPVTAEVREPGSPLSLRGRVDYLACSDICIPYEADLALDLPAGEARPDPEAHLINRFSVRVPGTGAGHGLTIESAEAGQRGDVTVLRVAATSAIPLGQPDLFVEGPAELWFSPPRVSLDDNGGSAVFEVSVEGIADFGRPLAGAPLTLTLADGARAAERTLTVAAAASGGFGGAVLAESAAPDTGGPALALILGLALLGGLILNLMPCVLPVLSIKVLGVIGHGGGEPRTVRLSFLATTAGIVCSFMVLAAALAALKSAGTAVGWGLQFQHPWFLITMTLVVALFACNLWGFFEVRLTQWASDLGGSAIHVHGLGGHFLSGAFVTVLATPCTAPFLGTAVGFALSRGAAEIFAVFAALGIGLALPYLAVAALPGLATRLPRPGPWMVKVRWVLGCALAATAVWLLSVLARHSGEGPALAVGALTAAAAGALYLRHRIARMGRAAGALTFALAAAALLVPLGYDAGSGVGDGGAPLAGKPGAKLDALWSPFEKTAIRRLITTGKVVFVDVTADWCLTCQINKSLVLTRGDVYRRLAGDGVVAMQADWTRPDDAISRYLATFGRYGIPFDAVYGPGAPRGIALPELLTEGAVLEALERAAGPAAVSSR